MNKRGIEATGRQMRGERGGRGIKDDDGNEYHVSMGPMGHSIGPFRVRRRRWHGVTGGRGMETKTRGSEQGSRAKMTMAPMGQGRTRRRHGERLHLVW